MTGGWRRAIQSWGFLSWRWGWGRFFITGLCIIIFFIGRYGLLIGGWRRFFISRLRFFISWQRLFINFPRTYLLCFNSFQRKILAIAFTITVSEVSTIPRRLKNQMICSFQ